MELKEVSPVAWSVGGCLCGFATAALIGAAAFAGAAFVALQIVRQVLRVEM